MATEAPHIPAASAPQEPHLSRFSSFFFKIAGASILFGAVPFGVLFLLLSSGYENIVMKLLSLNPGAADAVSAELSQFRLEVFITGGILFVFIIIGGSIADYFLARPVRLLGDFLKHINWDNPEMIHLPQGEDEVGVLAAELYRGIENFKRIRQRDKELSKAKSNFLTIAAHQLRTPLTEIKWLVQAALSAKPSPEVGQYLQKTSLSVDQMIHLVGDLLDVVRVEENRFGYSFKDVDIIAIVTKTVNDFADLSHSNGVSISLKLPPEPTLFANVDTESFSIALSNLFSNALSYTLPGGSVRVLVRKIDATKEFSIEVHDTGIGVPPDEQNRIFTQFFRASNAIRAKPNGSGIGLFLTKNLIERHGGTLSFHSEEGKGSVFICTLPLEHRIAAPEERSLKNFFEQIAPGAPEASVT